MYKTSVYTLVNDNIKNTRTSKTAKITKGDIVRITLTVCQFVTGPPYDFFSKSGQKLP